jgi:hypothetical protein
MIERPILFSAPMVRAILDGKKTQTRRIVKPQPDMIHEGCPYLAHGAEDTERYNPINCPYGAPDLGDPKGALQPTSSIESARNGAVVNSANRKKGDSLWVRETFSFEKRYDTMKPIDVPISKVWYISDGPKPDWAGNTRVSIFMPRWASRIELEIVIVRVERVQDISESDAIAEGLIPHGKGAARGWQFEQGGVICSTAKRAYELLWEKINGPDSWQANPWVFVIEFRRLRP